MNKITPFLWFNDNAEDAAEFYLSVFPEAKKVGELRSSGVGPWPAGKIATITIELMGQQMTFLNGGPAHALTPAFSYSMACKVKRRFCPLLRAAGVQEKIRPLFACLGESIKRPSHVLRLAYRVLVCNV